MSLLSALGCIFIVLKLIDVIDWSWWLVLLPIYGGMAVVLVLILALGAFAIGMFKGILKGILKGDK